MAITQRTHARRSNNIDHVYSILNIECRVVHALLPIPKRIRKLSQRLSNIKEAVGASGVRFGDENSLLGNDAAGDKLSRGDVEDGIPNAEVGPLSNASLLGGHVVSDLSRLALLNLDLIAARRVRVESRRGGSNVERNTVVLGGDGEVVGTNLVGSVTILADAVSADDHGVHLAAAHEARGGGVADKGRGHVLLNALVHSEAGALVPRAGLASVHLLKAVGVVKLADNAEGGAVAARREGAGVANGHDADLFRALAVIGDNVGRAVSHDALVEGNVFVVHGLRVEGELLNHLSAGSACGHIGGHLLVHDFDGVEEVYGGGAAGANIVECGGEPLADLLGGGECVGVGLGLIGDGNSDAEHSADGDGGGAADPHLADSGPNVLSRLNLIKNGLERELALVEEGEMATSVLDGLKRFEMGGVSGHFVGFI